MARQISVSDEIYAKLSRRKGQRSFSEVIGKALAAEDGEGDTEKSKAASEWLRAKMKKGYNLGKLRGTRSDWHAR